MKVSFELTIPNNGAWNGVYTGQHLKRYSIRTIRGKEEIERVKRIIANCSTYGYDFEDGWYAQVQVEIIDAKEAKRREKISEGFNYPWMISEILETGRIWKRKEIHHHDKTGEKPEIEDCAKPIEKKLTSTQQMKLKITEMQKTIDDLNKALEDAARVNEKLQIEHHIK